MDFIGRIDIFHTAEDGIEPLSLFLLISKKDGDFISCVSVGIAGRHLAK